MLNSESHNSIEGNEIPLFQDGDPFKSRINPISLGWLAVWVSIVIAILLGAVLFSSSEKTTTLETRALFEIVYHRIEVNSPELEDTLPSLAISYIGNESPFRCKFERLDRDWFICRLDSDIPVNPEGPEHRIWVSDRALYNGEKTSVLTGSDIYINEKKVRSERIKTASEGGSMSGFFRVLENGEIQ